MPLSPPSPLASLALRLLIASLLTATITAKITRHPKLVPAPVGERIDADATRYIVVLAENVTSLDTVSGYDEAFMVYQYNAALNGYALQGVPDDIMIAILDSDSVEIVYEVSVELCAGVNLSWPDPPSKKAVAPFFAGLMCHYM